MLELQYTLTSKNITLVCKATMTEPVVEKTSIQPLSTSQSKTTPSSCAQCILSSKVSSLTSAVHKKSPCSFRQRSHSEGDTLLLYKMPEEIATGSKKDRLMSSMSPYSAPSHPLTNCLRVPMLTTIDSCVTSTTTTVAVTNTSTANSTDQMSLEVTVIDNSAACLPSKPLALTASSSGTHKERGARCSVRSVSCQTKEISHHKCSAQGKVKKLEQRLQSVLKKVIRCMIYCTCHYTRHPLRVLFITCNCAYV